VPGRAPPPVRVPEPEPARAPPLGQLLARGPERERVLPLARLHRPRRRIPK